MTLPILRHRDAWKFLAMIPCEDGSGFTMIHTYRVQFDWENKNCFFQVPAGFHTNLASIPEEWEQVFKSWGKHTAAAVVHDCFYDYQAGSKEMADDVFEKMMILDGVSNFDSTVMAASVRIAGQSAWNDGRIDPDVQVLRYDGFWIN